MQVKNGLLTTAFVAGIAVCTYGQATPQGTPPSTAEQPASEAPASPAIQTYTVPAGTKVMMQVRSGLNTKTARVGDGVYLNTIYPVVVGSRVLIPDGVYVQGVIDRVNRAGRVKGRAELEMHFTSMIFPNGTVVEIPGVVNSMPGSRDQRVNSEGKIEQDGGKGKDVARAAEVGLAGASVGSIAGAASGHLGEGALVGGLGGVAVGTAIAMFTRGADITIEPGTSVEMVLQRPLQVEEANLAGTMFAAPGSNMAPSARNPRPLNKPIE